MQLRVFQAAHPSGFGGVDEQTEHNWSWVRERQIR